MLHKRKKVRGAVDRNEQQRKKSGLYGLLMMFVGALIAVAVGSFLYLSPFFNQRTTPALNPAVEVVPLTDETRTVNEYQFYEVLPKQQFQSIPEGVSVQENVQETEEQLQIDTVVEAPKKDTEIVVVEENQTYEGAVRIEAVNTNTSYILQVRSYDNAEDADNRRTEVMMAGVDAQVVKRPDGNGGVIYQVVSTPFESRDTAMTAYQRLQSNGIDSLVVEQKRQ